MVKRFNIQKSLTLKQTSVLCAILFVLASFMIYFFSDDSKARVLACDGNYYYTDQEVYSFAGASLETRLWLTPSTIMERKVSKQPLVESVKVKKSNGKITFKIKEKIGIGYYTDKSGTYILTLDGDTIQLKDGSKSCIEHLPLISGFDEKQRNRIVSEFQKTKGMDQTIFDKISEITPFKTSYDDNMVKMVMVDGNVVYSSMSSLGMIVKYQAVLTQLQGTSACLVLDADHNAVDKVDCYSFTTSKKDQVKLDEEDIDEEEDTNKDEEENDEENKEDTDTEEEQDIDLGNIDSLSDDKKATALDQVTDWVPDTTFGMDLEYSASTGYYRNPYTNDYYGWDDATGSFVPVYR